MLLDGKAVTCGASGTLEAIGLEVLLSTVTFLITARKASVTLEPTVWVAACLLVLEGSAAVELCAGAVEVLCSSFALGEVKAIERWPTRR